MFQVGQKVVCVDIGGDDDPSPLQIGAIYTISQIIPTSAVWWRGERRKCIGILLQEVAPPRGYVSFAPERFRPIVERKTDISIFKKMLTPKQEELVP